MLGNKTPLGSDSPVLGPCSGPHSGLWFLFCKCCWVFMSLECEESVLLLSLGSGAGPC